MAPHGAREGLPTWPWTGQITSRTGPARSGTWCWPCSSLWWESRGCFHGWQQVGTPPEPCLFWSPSLQPRAAFHLLRLLCAWWFEEHQWEIRRLPRNLKAKQENPRAQEGEAHKARGSTSKIDLFIFTSISSMPLQVEGRILTRWEASGPTVIWCLNPSKHPCRQVIPDASCKSAKGDSQGSPHDWSPKVWRQNLATSTHHLHPAVYYCKLKFTSQPSLLIAGCPRVSKWLGEVTGPERRQLHQHKQCDQGRWKGLFPVVSIKQCGSMAWESSTLYFWEVKVFVYPRHKVLLGSIHYEL